MDRAFSSGASGSPPSAPVSPSTGYPTSGNAGTGTPATKPGAWWYHMMTEEQRAVIVAAGITPDYTVTTQLRDAILALIAGASGNDFKGSVRVSTTANIASLAGGAPNTLDGVTLAANDRILVKDQTTASQNGLYYVSTLGTGANGTWTRSADADAAGELTSGSSVAVEEGTTQADSLWMLTTDGAITIGTTALTFVRKDAGAIGSLIPRGHIDGLTLSTAGASTTMSVAAGQATDSANTVLLSLAAGTNKNTNAWAAGAGNGGRLGAAAIANNTWYDWFLIYNPTTQIVEVGFDLQGSLTYPSGYTKSRILGSGLTNGVGQWTKFIQIGNEFWWDTPVLDFTGAGSAARVSLTCSIPRGRKMRGRFNVSVEGGGGGSQRIYLSDLANADLAPGAGAAPLSQSIWLGAASTTVGGQAEVWTNTTAQVGHRELNTNNVYIATLGWTDLRGKDA